MERTASTPLEDRGLVREAIGLREVLFQSVTHMAPAAAVAFSIIVGANFASGALPALGVFALVGCPLVAISIGQLAQRRPSAVGFYTARGIHPSIGFLVARGLRFRRAALVAPALYLIFGQVVAGTLRPCSVGRSRRSGPSGAGRTAVGTRRAHEHAGGPTAVQVEAHVGPAHVEPFAES